MQARPVCPPKAVAGPLLHLVLIELEFESPKNLELKILGDRSTDSDALPFALAPHINHHPTNTTCPTHLHHRTTGAMETVEAGIVAAVGGGELTVDRVRAEVRALSEGIEAKQVSVGNICICVCTFPCGVGMWTGRSVATHDASSHRPAVKNKTFPLSCASSTKQTEIQLIVGSRYHELIESADSVVRECRRACLWTGSIGIEDRALASVPCLWMFGWDTDTEPSVAPTPTTPSTPRMHNNRCRCTGPASASGSCSRSCRRASRRSVKYILYYISYSGPLDCILALFPLFVFSHSDVH